MCTLVPTYICMYVYMCVHSYSDWPLLPRQPHSHDRQYIRSLDRLTAPHQVAPIQPIEREQALTVNAGDRAMVPTPRGWRRSVGRHCFHSATAYTESLDITRSHTDLRERE